MISTNFRERLLRPSLCSMYMLRMSSMMSSSKSRFPTQMILLGWHNSDTTWKMMSGSRSSIASATTTMSISVTQQDWSSHLLLIDATELFVEPFTLTTEELQKVQPEQERQRQPRIWPSP